MIRCIPIVACANCPHGEVHYGHLECKAMGFKQLPNHFRQPENGKLPQPPDWCPLPPHATANEAAA